MADEDDDRTPVANITPFGLRMQPYLKLQVERAAKKNSRSLNAEIVHRIEQHDGNIRDLESVGYVFNRVDELAGTVTLLDNQLKASVRAQQDLSFELREKQNEAIALNHTIDQLRAKQEKLEDRIVELLEQNAAQKAQIKAFADQEPTIREIGRQNRMAFGMLDIYDKAFQEAAAGDDTALKRIMQTWAKTDDQIKADLEPHLRAYAEAEKNRDTG